MNYTEASLTDLFPELEVLHGDLAHARHRRKSACSDRDLAAVVCELGEALLVQLLLEGLHLVDETLLVALLVPELVLELTDLLVSTRRRHWPFHCQLLSSESTSRCSWSIRSTLVKVLTRASEAST